MAAVVDTLTVTSCLNIAGGLTVSASQVSGIINPDALTGTTVDTAATSLTLSSLHLGRRVRFTAGSAVSVTLPSSFTSDWNCMWEQRGAGRLTFAAAASGNLRNRSSHTRSAGQYAMGSLYVDTNVSSTQAEWTLAGDTST